MKDSSDHFTPTHMLTVTPRSSRIRPTRVRRPSWPCALGRPENSTTTPGPSALGSARAFRWVARCPATSSVSRTSGDSPHHPLADANGPVGDGDGPADAAGDGRHRRAGECSPEAAGHPADSGRPRGARLQFRAGRGEARDLGADREDGGSSPSWGSPRPEGNAPLAAIPGFEVAPGKTGTAQKLLPVVLANGKTVLLRYSDRHHVASFIGFFPASRPQVAISVIIDDADARAPLGVAYGGKVAAPVFKRLGERLIPYLGTRPTIDNEAVADIRDGGSTVIGYLAQNHALVRAFRARPLRRRTSDYLEYNRAFKMAPILSDYINEDEILALKGSLERPISGLVMDSRRVVPGNLFFALPGLRSDGLSFVDEAVSRGASAIIAQKIPVHPPAKVTFIQVADARAMLARVAQRYYKFPDRQMAVTGVTGTNGKTTVTHLIRHFLNGTERVGLLGTISYDLGARTVPSFRTTPEALDIFGMMAQMRDAGCRSAVMEVSSHGIAQQRVLGIEFAAAVFTNLTRDHLDFHKTLDAYFEVKTRLFMGTPAPKVAVVNLDDPYGGALAPGSGPSPRPCAW